MSYSAETHHKVLSGWADDELDQYAKEEKLTFPDGIGRIAKLTILCEWLELRDRINEQTDSN